MRKVLLNTGSNVVLLAFNIIIVFIMTPVILRALGAHDYGVWEIVAAVAGYMGLLDMGLRPAISRYTARYKALKDIEGQQVLFSTTLFLLGSVGGIVAAIFVAWALLWPDALTPEGEEATRYCIFLVIIGLQLMISFPGQVAASVLQGMQRFFLMNNITIVKSVMSSSIIYFFIDDFDPLLFIAFIYGLGVAIKSLVLFWLVRRETKGLIRFSVVHRSREFLSEILGFSVKSFIMAAATSLQFRAPFIIIAAMFGPASVVFFALPFAIGRHLVSLGWNLTLAFMPFFSGLEARGDKERVKTFYIKSSRGVIGIIAPLALAVMMLGPDFLNVWVGPEFLRDTQILIIIIILSLLLPFLNPFAGRYLTAIGKHGILAKIGAVSAVASVLASVVFAFWFGIVGVAFGALVPVAVSVPIVTWSVSQHIGVTSLGFFRQAVAPVISPLILFGVVLWAIMSVYPPLTYFHMIVTVLAGGIFYTLAFIAFAVSKGERAAIVRRLREFLITTRRQGKFGI